MNYNDAKFFSKFMWLIYILIGLGGITYVNKLQNQPPVMEETTTNSSQSTSTFFEVFDTQDISSDEEVEENKRSYLYKVEIVEDLTPSQYDKISKDIIEKAKNNMTDESELNSVNVKFYIGQEEVHSYNMEN